MRSFLSVHWMPILDSLQVFYGEATPARARIYAQALRPIEGPRWRLTGAITGPRCAIAATLPAKIALRDLGPGKTFLASASLPDPVFWSAGMPALYDVEVSLVDDHGVVRESATQSLGLRGLGVRDQSFFREGRRWVVRGADRRFAPAAPPAQWREAHAAIFVDAPDVDLCHDASVDGIVIVARVAGGRNDVASELRRLSRWAAVAIAVIDEGDPLDEAITAAAPNILLAAWAKESSAPPKWADAVFARADEPEEFARHIARETRPIVAVRALDAADLQDARRGCDDLQRDLATWGDFAGYLMV